MTNEVSVTGRPNPRNAFAHRYFLVEGRGEFPNDMLRYDECTFQFDTDADTAATVPQTPKAPPRRVRLTCDPEGRSAKFGPAFDRWKSFGWAVVSVDDSATSPGPVEAPQPTHVARYSFHGHTISVAYTWNAANQPVCDGALPRCDTCSIPMVISDAVVFATTHSIRSLVVDGVEIKRTN